MKLIILCTLFLGFSSAHEYEDGRPANLNCNCGWTSADSDEITYPWVVLILAKNNNNFLCAGTILTKWHVLSSADCLENEKQNEIVVCVGSKDKTKCGDGAKVKLVEEIYVNGGFDEEKSVNNIAMVRTVAGIDFNKDVGPACFPTETIINKDFAGTELIFLGWGESRQLKMIKFKGQPQNKCQNLYPQFIHDMHICAASDSEQNVMGNGGGTYVIRDTVTDRYTLVGVLDSIPTTSENPPAPSLLINFTSIRGWARRRIKWNPEAELCFKQ